jgi:uncharacterized protein (DUF1684 family)
MLFKLIVLLLLAPVADAYVAEIAKWRADREARLKSESGWTTVVGLHWLEQGENSVGSSPKSAVVLPLPAPEKVGTITLSGKMAAFVADERATVTSKGKPVTTATLTEDVPLEVGSITFYVIERGSRIGVRVRDKNAETRRSFRGLRWYDIDARWRIKARLEPPPKGRTVPIGTIVGDTIDLESAGYLVFTVNGREVRLEALYETPEHEELYVIFKDRTNGDSTYGAGRYMYPPLPVNGVVDLDFNKAYNPPCAYTAFATCPLPPRQNWLPVPVTAGEKAYDVPSTRPKAEG